MGRTRAGITGAGMIGTGETGGIPHGLTEGQGHVPLAGNGLGAAQGPLQQGHPPGVHQQAVRPGLPLSCLVTLEQA